MYSKDKELLVLQHLDKIICSKNLRLPKWALDKMSTREQKALLYNYAYLHGSHIWECLDSYRHISITASDIKYLQDIMTERFKYKQANIRAGREKLIAEDQHRYVDRNVYGAVGELAIGKFLGKDVVDETHGVSKSYDIPDLKAVGYNLGIKTATIDSKTKTGQIPMVPSVLATYPHICNYYDKKRSMVYLIGVAMPDIINDYKCDELVTFDDAYRKHKTAFIGMHKLIPIKTQTDLDQYR